MPRICLPLVLGVAALASAGFAQQGPYQVLKKAKVGGDGGFDYVYADEAGRNLYIARSGSAGRMTVFNLDTLEPAGEIPNTSAHGAAVDAKAGHGFATSKPVAMWDSKTLKPIKTIDVQGNPDGLMFDAFNQHVYILSHSAPNATVIDTKDGSVLGTIDLGGAPEQAVSDGKGHVYIDIEDEHSVAVVDAKTMKVTATYDLNGKGATCAGLAIDAKNNILFATCRNPQTMVILSAADGKILETLPIGAGTDGAQFNPATMEAFSSNRDGTLTIVKENSPTSFTVEQNLQTMTGAKTLALDGKTGHIFLIAAETAAPVTPAPLGAPTPPAPANGRGGRAQTVPGSFTIIEVGK